MTAPAETALTASVWPTVGAVCGALAVALGAFGAHGLKSLVADGRLEPQMLDTFEVAVRYQMYHALALVALGVLVGGGRAGAVAGNVAGWAFLAGIVIFSGMLYAYVFSGVKFFAMIVPIGGVSFIVGWVALAVALWRQRG
ncbi:MAG: DUF423 domain-containing protein [Pirellulales bacterium]